PLREGRNRGAAPPDGVPHRPAMGRRSGTACGAGGLRSHSCRVDHDPEHRQPAVNIAEAHVSTPMTWWRPEAARPNTTSATTFEDGSRVAFMALVAFTFILLLSPQAWFPILKAVRIAFLAATMAIAAHVVERTIHRKPVTPFSTEIGIVLALVGWALVTIPLSYWPGGSVRLLTDNYLKAVAFFWLLGTVITRTKQLRILAWSLVLCSVPLAATGLKNFLVGEVLSTRVPGL